MRVLPSCPGDVSFSFPVYVEPFLLARLFFFLNGDAFFLLASLPSSAARIFQASILVVLTCPKTLPFFSSLGAA